MLSPNVGVLNAPCPGGGGTGNDNSGGSSLWILAGVFEREVKEGVGTLSAIGSVIGSAELGGGMVKGAAAPDELANGS